MAKTKKQADESSPSFEEALGKLEKIVEEMESDELPLESLMQHFEEGSRLAEICAGKLNQAELKIKKLEEDARGNLVEHPFNDQENIEN